MIRQLIREMLFNESARKMSDLPPGVYVGIKEGSGYVQVYFCDKDGLDIKIERIVESAVDTADALIEELNKTKQDEK